MSNGPLNSYVAPSVITRTEIKGNVTAPPSGVQIPVFIGTGQETLTLTDHEMVRGSSSSVDLRINNEKVSENKDGGNGNFLTDSTNPNVKGKVDGTATRFQVKHFPIVSGTGQGRVTNNPQHVSVTVDGIDVVVAAVRGEEGLVTLQVPPQEGSEVEVTYHFKRTDTLRVDDVSDQVDEELAKIVARKEGGYEIVEDVSDTLEIEVDGVPVTIELTPGNSVVAGDLATEIEGQGQGQGQGTSLKAGVETDNQGREFLVITAKSSLRIGSGSANGVLGFYEGQRTRRTRTFFTHAGPIVVGDNGGRATDDPADVIARVDGVPVAIQSVDGSDRVVTLEKAPPAGAEVEIEYYFNTWQDTSDYLPNIDIRRVTSIGFAPGRNDYVEGLDFVIDRDNGEIHWGASTSVEVGRFTSVGEAEPFGPDHIKTTLLDDKVFMEEVEILSDREVRLKRVPVNGEGRGIETSDPQLVLIKTGATVTQAGELGKVTVLKVEPQTRRVTLKEPIPQGHNVYATYSYNRLGDYEFTIEKTDENEIEVTSPALYGGTPLFNVRATAGDGASFPGGQRKKSQAFISPLNKEGVVTTPVKETVTVTFKPVGSDGSAKFVFPNKGPFDFYSGISDKLNILVDGVTSYAVTVPSNSAAEVEGGPLTDLHAVETELKDSELKVNVNGQTFTIAFTTLTGLTGTIADDIDQVNVVLNTAFNGKVIASKGSNNTIVLTVDEVVGSSIEILDGTANQYLGFQEGDKDSEHRVDLNSLLSELLDEGVTASINVDGYLEIESSTNGSASSVEIGAGSTVTLPGTGLGVKEGDKAVGTEQENGFEVTSSESNGSGTGSNNEGVLGQTYVDEVTGLTFTLLEAGVPVVFEVESKQVTGSGEINRSVPGISFEIEDMEGVQDRDTAILNTYSKTGAEPGIGDYYYISYDYGKTDYSTKLFSKFSEVERHFGELGPNNPLTLAAYLAMQNGASIVAMKQVQKSPGLMVAPSNSYIRALEELKKPLEGGVRPDIIIPLTTDPSVMAATTLHCDTQSSPRNRNESRAIFGVASGTRAKDVSALAEGLNSDRAMILYPDSALMTLTDPIGNDATYVVDGTALAAALAGVIVHPSNDVATPLTRKTLVGFDRLNRTLEDVEKDMLATSGVTVLQDRAPLIEVRHGLTTNLENRLTSTPSVVAIRDYVQQQCRKVLERFIGLKFLSSRSQDVELALTGLLKSLVEGQIIADYTGVSAEPDPSDPTIMRVSAYYSPIFPLLYIDVHFVITANSV